MKVNISYSIDLEEVLSSAYSLYDKELKRFKNATKTATKSLEEPYEDSNLIDVLEAIKQYREASYKLDEKLAEINHILVGYAQIRYKEDASIDLGPEQQKEGKND